MEHKLQNCMKILGPARPTGGIVNKKTIIIARVNFYYKT